MNQVKCGCPDFKDWYLVSHFDGSQMVPDLEPATVTFAAAASAVDLGHDPAPAAGQVVGPALLPLVLGNLHSRSGIAARMKTN